MMIALESKPPIPSDRLAAPAEEDQMSELDDFLAAVLPRQNEVETALHRGDAAPRKAFWSAPAGT